MSIDRFRLLIVLIIKSIKNEIGIFLLTAIFISLLASILFISTSIKGELLNSLKDKPDVIVQRYATGKIVDTPVEWIEKIKKLYGISNLRGRVYGDYYFEQKGEHFFIYGLDFGNFFVVNEIEKKIKDFDIDEFLSKDYMIVGKSVKSFFDKYAYNKAYYFRPPNRGIKKVYIYKTLPKSLNLLSADMILVDIDLAREILGVDERYFTDIVFDVKNRDEIQNIYNKLKRYFFDSRVILKDDIKRYYQELFNYKGGFFLTVYILSFLMLLTLLYHRYNSIKSYEIKTIVVMKISGWSIEEIVWFKIIKNLLEISLIFMIGVIFAFYYIFYLDGVGIRAIFLGYSNLDLDVEFYPYFTNIQIFYLYLFFAISYSFADIFPLWKSAIKEIDELKR